MHLHLNDEDQRLIVSKVVNQLSDRCLTAAISDSSYEQLTTMTTKIVNRVIENELEFLVRDIVKQQLETQMQLAATNKSYAENRLRQLIQEELTKCIANLTSQL